VATDGLLQGVGDGAVIAAALALVKLALDFTSRRAERSLDQEERRGRYERDAEERLERLLRDQAEEAARRLSRRDDEIAAERLRRLALERDYALLCRSYQALEARSASASGSGSAGRAEGAADALAAANDR